MSTPRYPTFQYLSGKFIISAGSVLFRQNPSSSTLEICILHHTIRDEWLLPKGRKDRGETIEAAAIRETYEETGYPCRLWPQTIPTRAPPAGVNNIHTVEAVEGSVEPIAVTIRDLGNSGIKIIWWYMAKVEEGAEKVEGSQMEGEHYESVFLDAKLAVGRLTFTSDRDVVKQALEIVG